MPFVRQKSATIEDYYNEMALQADDDAKLMTNQLIYKLAPDSEGDYSWVRPGKIAWDWYNALILTGVDFKCGVNNETYKYYIDFASQYGIGSGRLYAGSHAQRSARGLLPL